MKSLKNKAWFVGIVVWFLSGNVAQAAGYAGMEWESPLSKIATSLTGPVAFFIALIGIFATGAALIWGGELHEFGRRATLMTLIVSVLVFASSLLYNLFGLSGAVI